MSSPASPDLLGGLADVADQYDALLCDVWGVIHNGQASFPAACAALARFRENRGPVILVSNSPRPTPHLLPQLRALAVPDAAWSATTTSGDVTRTELAARAPGPAWRIGPDRDHVLYEGLHLTFAGPEDAAFVSCSGLVDDEVETAEDYRAALSLAAARGLVMICANPDRVVHRGPMLIPCAGAVADVYESLGGRVVMAGKPYAPIYAQALAEVDRLAGRAVDRRRVLAIGDGVATDLAGAAAAGLDCLFITAGIHGADINGADGRPDRARLDAFLDAHGARARFAMAELGWGG